MSVYIGRPTEFVVYLSLAGVPAGGVAFSDVTFKYRKAGDVAPSTALTLTTATWTPIGNGYYAVSLAGSVLDTLGNFAYFLTGSSFDPVSGQFGVDPVPLPLLVPPTICIVQGNVVDLGAKPLFDLEISVRTLDLPQLAGQSLISGDLVRTRPDALGNFTLPLLRGQAVIVKVDKTGIENQITIPDAPTASLVDLLP